jgi:hypothetical protein
MSKEKASASFLKKRLAACESKKLLFLQGGGAMLENPLAQINKSLFASFSSEKEVLPFPDTGGCNDRAANSLLASLDRRTRHQPSEKMRARKF